MAANTALARIINDHRRSHACDAAWWELQCVDDAIYVSAPFGSTLVCFVASKCSAPVWMGLKVTVIRCSLCPVFTRYVTAPRDTDRTHPSTCTAAQTFNTTSGDCAGGAQKFFIRARSILVHQALANFRLIKKHDEHDAHV